VGLAVYLRWEMARNREKVREDIRREIVEAPVTIARELAGAVQRTTETVTTPPASDQSASTRPSAKTNAATDLFSGLLDVATKTLQQVDRIGLDATRMSDEQESDVGRQIDEEILKDIGELRDPASQRRLQTIVQPLLAQCRRKEIRYTVKILDSTNVNAFSVAGGYVYVTRAFLKEFPSDAALAMTLGHEIGHVDLRHCVEKIQYQAKGKELVGDIASLAQLAYATLRSPYTKDQEFEADEFGFVAARQAGWPAKDLLQFVRDLETYERKTVGEGHATQTIKPDAVTVLARRLDDYLASHPSTTERLARLEAIAKKERP
jgi:predicted Zn-dependent protease